MSGGRDWTQSVSVEVREKIGMGSLEGERDWELTDELVWVSWWGG
jgi:hypothetical protein